MPRRSHRRVPYVRVAPAGSYNRRPVTLITWNCRVGGFRRKAKRIASYRPDVLAVQEVEAFDSATRLDGDCQPTFRDRVADPVFPGRAIGVFSYTDAKLKAVDAADLNYSCRRYEGKRGNLAFQVVAVWPYATRSRETSYTQALVGLRGHQEWIRRQSTVVLGDFNDNKSYKSGHWQELSDLMGALGLASAYHTYFHEDFGAETRPTHFHGGKQTSAFHLDYCFLPEAWKPSIEKVQVGTFAEWCTLSDHVPLIVDLNL